MGYSQRYWLLYSLCAVALLGALYTSVLLAQEDVPLNCLEFGLLIPGECCCTNDCCREAEPGEFHHIGEDNYQSNVTGQFIKRKAYSADGRFIKCACSRGPKGWFKHPKATVFCIFPPMPST